MRKLFGIHVWRSMRTVRECMEVAEGTRIFVDRQETPEEHKARKKDMVTLLVLGKVITFRFRKDER